VLAVIEKQVGDHHAAHDLAQEAWLRVFGALDGFRPGAMFRPWLFAIALNLVRDEHRHRARRKRHVSDLEPTHVALAAASQSSDPTRRVEDLDVIDASIAGVPEPFRAALQLVDALGFSYEEAAVSLDCSAGTVKSRVHRGRLAFRDSYERLSGRKNRTMTSTASAPRTGALHGSPDSKEELA
jgi:RNA polymerase sigma-70 factor, ECF subfamily